MSMLPYKSHLYAHRIYDAGSSMFLPAIAARTPRWKPSKMQLASIKACPVPSIGDATAKWLANDPIADPTQLAPGNILHLTPQGNKLEQKLTVKYPRYVYILGGDDLVGMYSAVIAAYPALAAIGCRLVFGGNDGRSLTMPHTICIPITGGTATPVISTIRVNLTDEKDDYKAGELFIAVIQSSQQGNGFYISNAGNANQAPYATVSLFTPPSYNVVETQSTFNLLASPSYASFDANLAATHIARYKNFQQKYYYPNASVQFGSSPTITFTTSFAALLALVNPSGFPSASYPLNDANTLANQIVTDAVAFFTS